MKQEPSNDSQKALQGILQRQEFMGMLVSNIPLIFYVKDVNGRFVLASQATADYVGAASPDDLMGKTDFDYYPKDLAAKFLADEKDIILTGKPLVNKAEPRVDRHGVMRVLYTSKLPLKDDHGKIVGILGSATDVTDQWKAEENLKEERNSLRVLVDTLPDYIYVKDVNSRFLLANKIHATHMGFESPDELIGKTDFDFYTKDMAASFYADEQEIIRTGKTLSQKDEINTSIKGHTARVLTTKIPLRDSEGKITGIVGVGHDISKLSRMERNLGEVHSKLNDTMGELKLTQEQIIQSERLRALGQMASGIAHDFNNALTPILGYSDLLLNGPGLLDNRPTTINMLNDIRTAAVDASQTVRRLSEFYAPARKTQRKILDVHALIQSTISLTRPMWKDECAARGVDVRVVTKLDEVPGVFGNESQLREMLTNLIFNAVDAMPKGGTLTFSTRKSSSHTIMEVADTGIGMTEEVRRQCFEPFFTTKHKRAGGLGLAMVHGIVRQHEGTIEVQSTVGKGTTIIVSIPESSGKVVAEKPSSTVEVKQMNILLIDDEEVVRQVIEVCLKGDKHTVRTASDGQEGIELFKKEHFDMVITDRAMPGMSGDQLAAQIKKINPKTPVIMLTGFGHIMEDLQHHPAGVDLIVSKPVTRDSLRDAIQKAIAHKKH